MTPKLRYIPPEDQLILFSSKASSTPYNHASQQNTTNISFTPPEITLNLFAFDKVIDRIRRTLPLKESIAVRKTHWNETVEKFPANDESENDENEYNDNESDDRNKICIFCKRGTYNFHLLYDFYFPLGVENTYLIR